MKRTILGTWHAAFWTLFLLLLGTSLNPRGLAASAPSNLETTMLSSPPERRRLPLNEEWRFTRDLPESANPSADAGTWEQVALPHTPRLESEVVQFPYQGVC